MNCALLTNPEGDVGLALYAEARQLSGVDYFADKRRLQLYFANGEQETLPTLINPEFVGSLCLAQEMFIGHFAALDACSKPSAEYHVPLSVMHQASNDGHTANDRPGQRYWYHTSLKHA